ncbi:hypothetical protein DPMN_152101 [Dreissena polymorpha]|uniref:Uncharacterized protein n=1 Tax=Dreissena polymorpha TaxID=45954 RepID=A0A9D4J3K7_DREPO|nr:hypothetical protein DPMN_152101 [Dreissena polymorpha]
MKTKFGNGLEKQQSGFRVKGNAFINVCKQRYQRRESELGSIAVFTDSTDFGSIAVLVVKKLTFATYNKGLM